MGGYERQRGVWHPKVLPDGISSHHYSVYQYTGTALCPTAALAASAADNMGQIGTGVEMQRWDGGGGFG